MLATAYAPLCCIIEGLGAYYLFIYLFITVFLKLAPEHKRQ